MKRSSRNQIIPGTGLHHIAIGACDFARSLHFYKEGLGCAVVTQWDEGGRAALLDLGDGTHVELFERDERSSTSGVLLHFALRADDCAAAIERAQAAGATITITPTDALLPGDPPLAVRYAFCTGPNGEEIEFLQSNQI